MSYLTQMAGLAVQNFVSAAVGLAVAVALVRGLARRRSATIGNFWVDLVRGTVRVLLPLALVFTVVVVSQGAVQTLRGPEAATTVEGGSQSIPGGPFASQEAIKEIGTNGGGTLNANSAHPLSNPNGFTNLLQMGVAPADPVRAHLRLRAHGQGPEAGMGRVRGHVRPLGRVGRAGHRVRGRRQQRGRPTCGRASAKTPATSRPAGTWRARRCASARPRPACFAASTTGTSTGAVIAAHDSFTPLGGRRPARQHDAGGGQPGRGGRRPLRDADLRPAGGVHRRADGRPDTGVPRQEDPGGRDEARGDLHPRRAAGRARLHRRPR